jgi:hypothetical protein
VCGDGEADGDADDEKRVFKESEGAAVKIKSAGDKKVQY